MRDEIVWLTFAHAHPFSADETGVCVAASSTQPRRSRPRMDAFAWIAAGMASTKVSSSSPPRGGSITLSNDIRSLGMDRRHDLRSGHDAPTSAIRRKRMEARGQSRTRVQGITREAAWRQAHELASRGGRARRSPSPRPSIASRQGRISAAMVSRDFAGFEGFGMGPRGLSRKPGEDDRSAPRARRQTRARALTAPRRSTRSTSPARDGRDRGSCPSAGRRRG